MTDKELINELVEALRWIADKHIGDPPASVHHNESEWVWQHIKDVRTKAALALVKVQSCEGFTVDEEKFLAAVDRDGDVEVGAGHPDALAEAKAQNDKAART